MFRQKPLGASTYMPVRNPFPVTCSEFALVCTLLHRCALVWHICCARFGDDSYQNNMKLPNLISTRSPSDCGATKRCNMSSVYRTRARQKFCNAGGPPKRTTQLRHVLRPLPWVRQGNPVLMGSLHISPKPKNRREEVITSPSLPLTLVQKRPNISGVAHL